MDPELFRLLMGNGDLPSVYEGLMAPSTPVQGTPPAPPLSNMGPLENQSAPSNPIQDILKSVAGFSGGMPEGFPANMSQVAANNEQDMSPIDVVGDGWKPRGQTILGAIADAYLMSRGMQPGFQQNRDKRNINEAMQGFIQNPQQAMSRLMRIPGQEGTAFGMYDKLQDNRRQAASQERMDRSLDMRNQDYVFGQIAGMMGKATPENWGKMRDLAKQIAKVRGLEEELVDSVIPAEYDPDSIEFIRYGAIKPKDQITQENLKEYRDERLEDFDNQEAGRNARSNASIASQEQRAAQAEAGRNERAARAEEGRDRRATKPVGKERLVPTPRGDMIVSPDGTKGKIGDQLWMRVGDTNQWKRVK